jgi:branched-chain amino acid transport system substrate-binding protein
VADYTKAFGQEPGTYSDVAYDAATMFPAAVDAGNTTPEKINRYLGTINHQGVANTYRFTSIGELEPSLVTVWAFTIAEGRIVPDQEIKGELTMSRPMSCGRS